MHLGEFPHAKSSRPPFLKTQRLGWFVWQNTSQLMTWQTFNMVPEKWGCTKTCVFLFQGLKYIHFRVIYGLRVFFNRHVHRHFNGVSCVKCSYLANGFFFVDLSLQQGCMFGCFGDPLFLSTSSCLLLANTRTNLEVTYSPSRPDWFVSMRLNSPMKNTSFLPGPFDNFQPFI